MYVDQRQDVIEDVALRETHVLPAATGTARIRSERRSFVRMLLLLLRSLRLAAHGCFRHTNSPQYARRAAPGHPARAPECELDSSSAHRPNISREQAANLASL